MPILNKAVHDKTTAFTNVEANPVAKKRGYTQESLTDTPKRSTPGDSIYDSSGACVKMGLLSWRSTRRLRFLLVGHVIG